MTVSNSYLKKCNQNPESPGYHAALLYLCWVGRIEETDQILNIKSNSKCLLGLYIMFLCKHEIQNHNGRPCNIL